MKKTLLIVAMFFGIATCSLAGEPQEMKIFNHLGMGVGVGLTGIDIEVGSCCTDWLQCRAGVAFMPISSYNGIEANMKISDQQWAGIKNYDASLTDADRPNKLNMDATLNMTNFKFLVDFFPFRKSSFHITAGFYIGPSQLFDVTGTAVGSTGNKAMKAVYQYNQGKPTKDQVGMELGDYKITPDQNGEAKGIIKVNSFKPYVGVGFGRIVPKKTRLSFACDMGVQFWGTPKIYTQDKELTEEGTNGSDGGVVKIASKITVYPVINFRLTGRIF